MGKENLYLESKPRYEILDGLRGVASILVFSILVAYAMLKAYDEPVREWLKEHWLKRPAKQTH